MVRKDKILQDILLKMSYDLSKTLNENIALVEQKPDNLMFGQPDNPRYKKSNGTIDTDKYQKDMKQMYEYRHVLMDIAAIGTFFIPVVGPLLSLGIELANSGMYYAEGDDYMAGLSLAFALIPGGELIGKIPAVKKLGEDGLKKLLKKTAVKNAKYTDDELKVLEEISNNKNWISRNAATHAIRNVISKTFSKLSARNKVAYIIKLSRKYPKTFSLMGTGIKVGGVFYSWCLIAEKYEIKNSPEYCKKEVKLKSSTTTKSNEPIIVTDFDGAWDYKKEGNKYYTKRKGSDKWILAVGASETAIREKVFKNQEYSDVKEKLNISEEELNKALDNYIIEKLNKTDVKTRDSILDDFVTNIL